MSEEPEDQPVPQAMGQGDPAADEDEGGELTTPFIYIPDLSSDTRWARLIFSPRARASVEAPRAGFSMAEIRGAAARKPGRTR
jgi:hypothetical protein